MNCSLMTSQALYRDYHNEMSTLMTSQTTIKRNKMIVLICDCGADAQVTTQDVLLSLFITGTDFRRQNLTYRRQNLMSKGDPRTERVRYF